MGYNIDFVNNKKYGADDINSIRTTIMTEGIIRKDDDSCLVTLTSNEIHINTGEALFKDGCRIEITEEEVLAYDGNDCYVYFNRNYYEEPCLEKGTALPENSIPLGRITDGEVTDLRTFATLKIPTMAPNRYLAKELNLDFSSNKPKRVTKTVTFEDRTEVNYVTFIHQYGDHQTRVFINFIHGYAFGYCDDGRFTTPDNVLLLSAIGVRMSYVKSGNTITFTIVADTDANLGAAIITAL